MFRQMLKSKIQKAIITETNLNYKGSIGIDKAILKKSDILPGEKVQLLNYNNGDRLETYTIEEKPNSGNIVLYGPAAKKGKKGEEICILSYCMLEDDKSKSKLPKIVYLDKNNSLKEIKEEKEIM